MIHDVYKINETSENVDTVPYGRWNPSTGIFVDDYNIWGRRANLKGFMFRYPTLLNYSWEASVQFHYIKSALMNSDNRNNLTTYNESIIWILELLRNIIHQNKLERMMVVHRLNVSKATIQI